jgi:hypothetical protein
VATEVGGRLVDQYVELEGEALNKKLRRARVVRMSFAKRQAHYAVLCGEPEFAASGGSLAKPPTQVAEGGRELPESPVCDMEAQSMSSSHPVVWQEAAASYRVPTPSVARWSVRRVRAAPSPEPESKLPGYRPAVYRLSSDSSEKWSWSSDQDYSLSWD